MAKMFGRFNPERRIERKGDFSQTENAKTIEIDTNKIDERMTKNEASNGNDQNVKWQGFSNKVNSPRQKFIESIRVEEEPEQTKNEDPLTLAYQELDRARCSGSRDGIIKAEDRILDLEKAEQDKEYRLRIKEIKEKLAEARVNGALEAVRNATEARKNLIAEMKYDELNYQIKKLQNSQRLSPNNETLKRIGELNKELQELQQNQLSR